MIKTFIFFIFITLSLQAEEFQPLKAQNNNIKCTLKNQLVTFAGQSQSYALYDKNAGAVKLIVCEKITLKNEIFFSLLFSSEVHDTTALQKVLTYEIALLNKKTGQLQSVRSEIVDQVELSGDPSNYEFESTIRADWGLSKKDQSILIKLELSSKNEKPFFYLLKYNQKSFWFENIFDKQGKTQKK